MKKELLQYISVAKFLKDALGERYCVSLIDSDDLATELAVGENGISGGREISSEDKGLLADILGSTEMKKRDYLCGFSGTANDTSDEKKSVFNIRDEFGEISGFLCITEQRGDLYMVREVLDQLLLPDGQSASGSEHIAEEVNSLLRERIVEVWDRHKSMHKTMRKAEKIDFISELFEMGIFRVKGAASQVSEVTGISQASLYRYLSEAVEG